MPPGMYSYNATLEPVYRGTSVKVFGMAVDWLAGSVYWTDARYNWITVAATDRLNVFRHLITTGLDKPMGIAVHPVRGYVRTRAAPSGVATSIGGRVESVERG